jgi:hypothetical protein
MTRAKPAARVRRRVCRYCEQRSDEAIHAWFAMRDGLLRGACHRGRIRTTGWLAMTENTIER